MRRVPVDRFGDELVGVAAEPEEVDELGGLGALAPLGAAATAADPVIDGTSHDRSRASSATMIVSRTVRSGYSRAAWNAAAEPEPVAPVRRPVAADVAAEHVDRARSTARTRRSRSSASTCRRRWCR